ncbi:MAG: ATP-binding protein [Granulosicoccaceae bacterium]
MSSTLGEDKLLLPKLFARLSHDSIRNFRQIRALFEMLTLDAEFDESQLELVKMINEIAKKGEYGFEGLERFANQIDVGDMECELVFSDVLQSVQREFTDVSVTALDDLDFVLRFNPQALKSILVEVFSNARKYCPERSSAELKVGTSVDARSSIRSIRLSAKSIGAGSYGLESLWLPYARDSNVTHIEGYGVGLTIVAYLVAQSGGEITLDCEESSAFNVSWVLAEPAQLGLDRTA